MISIIKHLKNCLELQKLINSKKNKMENIDELYWYDLNINFATSIIGILKVFFFRLKITLLFFKKKSEDIYQHENPKNYGAENIYYTPIKKVDSKYPNPTIWNCKNIRSSPWFNGDKWSKMLENNVQIIKDEFLKSKIENITHPGNKLLAENGEWSSLTLIGAQGTNQSIIKEFPKTIKILEELPFCKTFGFVAFSKLSPGTHIKAHTGSCNLRLRYHLGIKVPEPNLVKIRVGEKINSWNQDKCIIFDDSFEHEVFHNGKDERIVFIVDLWHHQLSKNEVEILESLIFKNFGKI